MPQFTEEVKKEITEALQKKQATQPCSRCGKTDFAVLDGFPSSLMLNSSDQPFTEANKIPSAGVICNNCGNISQHALGVLLAV
jgi:ribosomal protein L37E